MTPEQALKRMHTDAGGVVGPQPGDTLPWLNTVSTVDAIVRGFAAAIIKRLANPDTEALVAFATDECMAMNNLFLGYEAGEDGYAGYKRGPWNTPESCGAFVRIHCAPSEDGDTRSAVRDAFMSYASDVAAIASENLGQPPESWAGWIDGPTERMVRSLLGFPPGTDPDVEGPDVPIYEPR